MSEAPHDMTNPLFYVFRDQDILCQMSSDHWNFEPAASCCASTEPINSSQPRKVSGGVFNTARLSLALVLLQAVAEASQHTSSARQATHICMPSVTPSQTLQQSSQSPHSHSKLSPSMLRGSLLSRPVQFQMSIREATTHLPPCQAQCQCLLPRLLTEADRAVGESRQLQECAAFH